MSTSVRLQKYIADSGVTSRRKAEELILARRVKVNGEICDVLGTKVNPGVDAVEVDQKNIYGKIKENLYIVYHKPRGVVTTVSDPEGRPTVMDDFKTIPQRIYPVGRLDFYSEGLLLLTNDGNFAHHITHPKFEIVKTYEVKVFGAVTHKMLAELKKGRWLSDGYARPKSVRVIKQLPNKTWLEFRLNEGRNREIRKICDEAGLTIDKLRRVAIGGLSIKDIGPGHYHLLTKREIHRLIGMNEEGEKLPEVQYRSPFKTIDVRKKLQPQAKLATDRTYVKYKKENYNTTMQSHKRINEEAEFNQEMENHWKKRDRRRVDASDKKRRTKDIPEKARYSQRPEVKEQSFSSDDPYAGSFQSQRSRN